MGDSINILGFIEGNCSEHERDEVYRWINSSQENKLYFEHLKSIWQNKKVPPDYIQFDPDLEWDAFKANNEINFDDSDSKIVIDKFADAFTEKKQLVGESPTPLKNTTILWTSLAMILALAAIIASIWFATPPPQYIEFKEVATDTFLILEDGTKVSAYIGSSMKTPASFKYKSSREVEMKGNILFEVTNLVHQPFIVYTENAGIEVLGTKFLILSDSNYTEVSNESGHLRLFSKKNENLNIELFSGDRIKYDGSNFIDLKILELRPEFENIPALDSMSIIAGGSEVENKEVVRLNDVLTYLRRISKGRVKFGSGMNFKDNPVVDIEYEGKTVRQIIRLIQEKGIVVYTTWCDGCYEIQEIILKKQ